MVNVGISDLAKELSLLLGSVSGSWTTVAVSRANVGSPRPARVGLGVSDGHLEAWVQSSDGMQRMSVICSDDLAKVEEHAPLLHKIVSVFNHDLEVVGDSIESREVWLELSETRFLRAAARLSNISTEYLVRRIRTFEAAARQTYEGSPFVGSVVMSHSVETFRAHAGDRFRPFTKSVTFEQALLHEKWLKPFLEAGDFALVTASFRGTDRGFTDAVRSWDSPELAAPTAALEPLYGYLKPGTSILSASPVGDVYFALPTGVTFVNSKGRWRYQNWSPLMAILLRRCSRDVAKKVLRLIRASSYDHQGALYVMLGADVNVSDVVPDHADKGRSSETLRATVSGIRVDEPSALSLLGVASRIDGAVVLASDGRVLDVASMITEPSRLALEKVGVTKLVRFAGARSTAAWNASIYGIAIKVSDDGPVDVYEEGVLVFHAD